MYLIHAYINVHLKEICLSPSGCLHDIPNKMEQNRIEQNDVWNRTECNMEMKHRISYLIKPDGKA